MDSLDQFALRLPLAVEEKGGRVFRVGSFLIQIALRANVIGDGPPNTPVTAEHDGWHTRERHAGHVERAAGQLHFVPARHRGERDVRVACDHRFSRLRPCAAHHPIVAAEALVRIPYNVPDGLQPPLGRSVRTGRKDAFILRFTGQKRLK